MFALMGKHQALSPIGLPKARADDPLARATLQHACDRMALTLVSLAQLKRNDLAAFRRNEQRIAKTYPDQAAAVAARLKLVASKKGREQLIGDLLALLESF